MDIVKLKKDLKESVEAGEKFVKLLDNFYENHMDSEELVLDMAETDEELKDLLDRADNLCEELILGDE